MAFEDMWDYWKSQLDAGKKKGKDLKKKHKKKLRGLFKKKEKE